MSPRKSPAPFLATLAVLLLTLAWVLPASGSAVAVPSADATPAPTEAAPSGLTGTVKSATLNVRAGPGTTYKVIGTVKKGQTLNLVGRNANTTWLQACCWSDQKGWVFASYVTVNGDAKTLPVATDVAAAGAAPAAPAAPGTKPSGVLLYSVLNTDADRWELWRYTFANGQKTFVKEWRTELAASPDGKQLAYFVWPDAGIKPGVYVSNLDLSNETAVIPSVLLYYPSWSPDSQRLVAFVGTDDKGPIIVGFNKDGGGLRMVGMGEYPAWSPKENWVAHRECKGGACGVYLIDADNPANERRLTTGGSDGQPAWSPDGKQLAYISQDDGNFEIYRINVDGTGKTRLTSDPASDGLPVWSPDGKWIAFRSDRGGGWAIWVMRPDGTGLTKVVDAPVLPLWFMEKIAWVR